MQTHFPGPPIGRLTAACLLVIGAGTARPAQAQFPTGKPAPAFRLKTLAGKRVSLSQLRGKVVFLDFWGPN